MPRNDWNREQGDVTSPQNAIRRISQRVVITRDGKSGIISARVKQSTAGYATHRHVEYALYASAQGISDGMAGRICALIR